jgi:hypothetical protein
MSESLLRKVVNAALKGERSEGGWLKVEAPSATDKDISLAIMEAEQRGLVEACKVSTMDSAYPEWRLVGPTGATEQFLRKTRTSKKFWAVVATIGTAIVAILKWFIPILVNLAKK